MREPWQTFGRGSNNSTGRTNALRAAVAALERRIAELIAENRALHDQLDEAQRQAARQSCCLCGMIRHYGRRPLN